ncbi:MAG: NADH-dependent [FeFe] hydrogenase, group A6 [Bacteroidaceae bacterium]|nr:NADH-dependent [FeFe] hydrogenase, group A6 [Bacteroidaceae bacterium]MEA5100474.1 NADH-dependent [FeFe] hydrogenase, group A6 [Bacteroidales bacterium]
MEKINIIIDNKSLQVEKGQTVLKAARAAGIEIPTLCYYELDGVKLENRPGGCRICVVEIEGRKNLAPACATEVAEGMVIHTCSLRVVNARRTVLELILSDHPADCLICPKNGKCELQSLAQRLGVREIPFQGEQSTYRKDLSPAIIRDVDKCVMCRRCETVCNVWQTVGALSAVNRGFQAVVAPAFEQDLVKSPCTYCGQCIMACPVGALSEVDQTRQVITAISDPKKTVVVQTAPAVRVALGEEFGMEPGSIVTGQMAAALRRIGFDYIFDTDFAADLTIMEEGTELLTRIDKFTKGDKNVKLPILTSCCPGWVNFFETNYPDMLDVPSTAKSPQQMFGAVAKNYLTTKLGIKREDMVVVSIMPCVAKKFESQRDEFKENGNPDVDYSLTTRELAELIRQFNIDFKTLPIEDFDNPLGESTGAGVIFGATGGVIEAATRTAYELFTGKKLEKVDFTELRGLEGVREATVDFNGTPIKIGIAHGLSNARQLLDEVKKGNSGFHAIEVMACPGGCIGGAGQPFHHGNFDIIRKRQEAIYREDAGKPIRKSHENPYIQALYKEWLGTPCGEISHHLLHTHYFDKSKHIEIEG